ncbi:minichromosome maintenance domain-containing protein 2-like isoform X3 [Dreissena polymorpha]|uniref:minichromosome maintenance domain-containing protein 2-like isoform X3 n=1 Tax=Dreissena polymorpha TaxID=45954 RepID=UPI00226473A2|nr:minichromosome maintenance domain-containing protein 2-like isoform X3 [Dreissena polymorpha]
MKAVFNRLLLERHFRVTWNETYLAYDNDISCPTQFGKLAPNSSMSSIECMESQLHLYEKVLEYLDQSGNLKLIKAQCEKHKKNKTLVYMFKLLINPAELCEADAYLGNLLLSDPVTTAGIFQQVLYKAVVVLELLPVELTPSQVAVVLRLTHLPVFTNINTVRHVSSLTTIHDLGIFCRLRGVVTGISAITKYTLSVRYYCPDTDCEGYYGNQYIRVHVPGASEAQTVGRDFKCASCLCTLQEDKSSRTLSERVVAEVIPEQIISIQCHDMTKSRTQSVSVYIRDDLTKLVEIGETYDIVGVTRKDIIQDGILLTLEANNVKKVSIEVSSRKLLKEIPRTVLQLYSGDICPPGSYFHLKFAILLSLMSKWDHKSRPVHVLAVGRDMEMMSRLLQYGLRFHDNTTTLTAGQSLTGRVSLDKYNSAPYFVDGGVLHLSQGGVCYVGDVNRLKKAHTQQLQSALSGSKVVTDVGSKFTGGLPHHLEHALRGRVWAFGDSSPSKRAVADTKDAIFRSCQTGDIPITLLESFSLVCFPDSGDMSSIETVENAILEHTLVTAMICESETSLPISAQDFIQFIKFASRLRPKFSRGAEALVHNFYLSSRKSRSTGMDGTDVPVNADQTILSMAYCHAKLALRNEVTLEDALMAIHLYEEYLTVRFGFSTLNVQPLPHVTPDLLSYCLGPENDAKMQAFHSSLLRYCSLASVIEE